MRMMPWRYKGLSAPAKGEYIKSLRPHPSAYIKTHECLSVFYLLYVFYDWLCGLSKLLHKTCALISDCTVKVLWHHQFWVIWGHVINIIIDFFILRWDQRKIFSNHELYSEIFCHTALIFCLWLLVLCSNLFLGNNFNFDVCNKIYF